MTTPPTSLREWPENQEEYERVIQLLTKAIDGDHPRRAAHNCMGIITDLIKSEATARSKQDRLELLDSLKTTPFWEEEGFVADTSDNGRMINGAFANAWHEYDTRLVAAKAAIQAEGENEGTH